MHAIRIAIAAGALAMTVTSAFADAPVLYTRWKDIAMSQQDCIAQGRVAVTAAGFGNIKVSTQSVFAQQGGHCSITIRCVAEKRLAFFAAASANMDACQRLTDRAADRF